MIKKVTVSFIILLFLGLTINLANAAPPPQGGGQEYVIQAGDWLSKIAAEFYGDRSAYVAIVEATNKRAAVDSSFAAINDPDRVEVGQKLWLPEATSVQQTLSTRGSIAGAVAAAPNFKMAEAGDFSRMDWLAAFEAMHQKFSREYALGAWKEIDWAALHHTFQPRIAAAQADHDARAYYLALREYLFSIPDGHLQIGGNDLGLRQAATHGSYGLTLAELDDGRIIANRVLAGGPAAGAGMQQGAQLVTWGGRPINEAVAATSVLWAAEAPPATSEGHYLAQLRMLPVTSLDSQVEVTFINPAETEPATAILRAVADHGQTLALSNSVASSGDTVTYQTLPSGYGYIRLSALVPLKFMQKIQAEPGAYTIAGYEQALQDELYTPWRQAIQSFVQANVPGLIIDVRGNLGGADKAVVELSGHFYAESAFYEYQALYNALTNKFELNAKSEKAELWIQPLEPRYHGPIVVLINSNTTSSGEGFSLSTLDLPNGHVAGFYGSYGSFGITGGSITMPNGIRISYPTGQARDANYLIQLDSRRDPMGNWVGGVQPDLRIPRTWENVIRAANGEDVELEFAIQWLQGQ